MLSRILFRLKTHALHDAFNLSIVFLTFALTFAFTTKANANVVSIPLGYELITTIDSSCSIYPPHFAGRPLSRWRGVWSPTTSSTIGQVAVTCWWLDSIGRELPVSQGVQPAQIALIGTTPEPDDCPPSGTPADVVNRLNWGESGLDGPINIGGSRSINGCLVVPVYADVACNWDETMHCKVITGYEFSGQQSTQQEPISDDDILESEPSFDALGVLPTTNQTTFDRHFEEWPDGSTTETVTTVTTERRGAGSTRDETETTVTVNYSNGITRTETTTQTTITNPDGSKTVTTDKTTTFTQNPVNTINVTKPTTVQKTTGTPTTATQTSTTTETFDSDGNKTGESTSSTGSGDQVGGGNGDGEGDGEGCEDCDPPNYEESGSWWQSNYPNGIQGILDQHRQSLLQSSGIAQMTEVGISSGGSFPIWTFPSWSIGPLAISAKTIDIDSRIFPFMRAALLFLAAIMCRRLVFGG